jgi:hypothetical protein
MPEKSILDARLAEIDRRLRTIQSGLAPAVEPDPAQSPSMAPVVPPEAAPVPKRLSDAPPDRQAAELVAELRALVDAHERLLASARDRLEGRAPAAAESWVSVSAGPFAGTDALRRFEGSLRALPVVREVVVREFEGENRAIIDVHLAEPTP